MFDGLLTALTGSDALIRAYRGSNRQRFVELFGRSTVMFLNLPPGLEDGLDPSITQEQFLTEIRNAAQDLSNREEFAPFCRARGNNNSLLLFTQKALALEFIGTYVRKVNRIMPFQSLGVEGRVLVPKFRHVDTFVLNAGSKHEYELSKQDMDLLRNRWAGTSPTDY